MNDARIEEYLWDPEAETATEVAALERLVAPCRFEPVPLAWAPSEQVPASASGSIWKLALAVAAGIVGLLWLLRPVGEPGPPPPPAASPPVQITNVIETPPEPPPVPELAPPEPPPPPPSAPPPPPLRPPAKQAPDGSPKNSPKKSPEKPVEPVEPVPTPAPIPDVSLPDKLSPTDILAGMKSVKGPVAACGRKHEAASGTKVAVKFTIEGATGSVVEAVVTQSTYSHDHSLDPDHPAVPCVTGAARKAQFRRFRAEAQSFTYKFRL